MTTVLMLIVLIISLFRTLAGKTCCRKRDTCSGFWWAIVLHLLAFHMKKDWTTSVETRIRGFLTLGVLISASILTVRIPSFSANTGSVCLNFDCLSRQEVTRSCVCLRHLACCKLRTRELVLCQLSMTPNDADIFSMKSSLAICMRCFAGGDASCEATGIRGLLGPGLLRTSELRCSRGEDMRCAAAVSESLGF